MSPPSPASPSATPYALRGRIVTMDVNNTILDDSSVYVDAGRIVATVPSGAVPPHGYESVIPIDTAGTIFPGLIELHNHLSYDVLQLWSVPKRYTNRNQWAGTPDYQTLISGPMQVLGQTPGYVEAVVRYVECKCLLGGVTTSQGIALFSNAGIARYYRGCVRNVESTDAADLPEAVDRIADVEALDVNAFDVRLQKSSCLLLHLSEGTDAQARAHFTALQLAGGAWAITPALAGIHCVALTDSDFAIMSAHGGAMVWSPLSNLLLYGHTADVASARTNGVRIGIGSDWSPSGSKNLLGELKIARLVSASLGGVFSDRDLVAMVTRDAAAILTWGKALGSIEAGKHADLLVVSGTGADPYATLLQAHETDIDIVVIDGVARYGIPTLMQQLGGSTESWQVGGQTRALNLTQAIADPAVGALTLAAAQDRLQTGLHNLPQLALALEHPTPQPLTGAAQTQWFLRLDEAQPEGVALRLELPSDLAARRQQLLEAPSAPLSQTLKPLDLDPLTANDDSNFVERLLQQPNLPTFIRDALPTLY